MSIQVKCPQTDCGQLLRVKDELGGKTVRCPSCKTALKLPAPAMKSLAPPPVEKATPVKPSRPPAVEVDDRPAPKARKGRDEEYDDYEDDRPVKKGKAAKKKPEPEPEEDLPDTFWKDSELLRHDRLMAKARFSFWGSTFQLTDPDTKEEVGMAKEFLPTWKGMTRGLKLGPISFRDWMSVDIQVRESLESPVLFTVRKLATPMPWQLTSTIQVLDFHKEKIGHFKTKLFSFLGGFWLYDADGEKVAELKAQLSLKKPRLEFLDVEGRPLGHITSEIFDDGGKKKFKVVWGSPGLTITLEDRVRDHLPTKVLLLAATLAMELTGVGTKLVGKH
jgi:hypothetical protein